MKQFLLHLTLLLSLVLVVGCESQQETPKPEPTPEPTPEVFSLNIEVTNITPYNAVLTITPSNDSDSYACVFLSSEWTMRSPFSSVCLFTVIIPIPLLSRCVHFLLGGQHGQSWFLQSFPRYPCLPILARIQCMHRPSEVHHRQ